MTTTSTDSPLRRIRKARGLTLEKVAAQASVSRCWLGYLEREGISPSPRVAERLAAVLKVNAGELLAP